MLIRYNFQLEWSHLVISPFIIQTQLYIRWEKKKERKEKKKKRRKGTHAHVVHIMIERKEEWTRRISHILTLPYWKLHTLSGWPDQKFKIQNSENFFSKSENHQKFFSKNQKQIRKNNFLQTNVYHVVILAFTTLLELCSLILLHFRKCFTRKKGNGMNIALS